MTDGSPEADLLARAWAEREERAYPELFGPLEGAIYSLSSEIFASLGRSTVDPRWLHLGVMLAPPTAARPTWAYVTSGLSNPWEAEPSAVEISGLGCELVLETSERAEWAIWRLQHLLAYQQLLGVGHYAGRPLLSPYDRIPLRGSIVPGSDSALSCLLVCPPPSGRTGFRLESGQVELLQLVGITDEEAALAREQGGPRLVELLESAGTFPMTEPTRRSTVAG